MSKEIELVGVSRKVFNRQREIMPTPEKIIQIVGRIYEIREKLQKKDQRIFLPAIQEAILELLKLPGKLLDIDVVVAMLSEPDDETQRNAKKVWIKWLLDYVSCLGNCINENLLDPDEKKGETA